MMNKLEVFTLNAVPYGALRFVALWCGAASDPV